MKLTIFGATGRTGRYLVEQALAAGHEVTAFLRDPAKLAVQHERLRIAEGDIADAARVEEAVAGADAVVSALGPTKNSPPTMLTVGWQNILAAMRKHGVQRLVTLTGAGVSVPGDPPSLGRTVMLTLLKRIAPQILEDSQRSVDLIRSSDRDWTVVRAPRLKDGPRTGKYRSGTMQLGPRASISRGDVADFLLKQAGDRTYARQAPMVSQ